MPSPEPPLALVDAAIVPNLSQKHPAPWSTLLLQHRSLCLPVQQARGPDGNFDLWACRTEDVPKLCYDDPRSLRLLDDSELARCIRFRLSAPLQQFVATRVFVRLVLSRYVDVPPEDWRFVKSTFGRPEISPDLLARAASRMSSGTLRFNLSHAGSLTLLMVSTSGCVGVDVEDLTRQIPVDEIAPEVLSENELARVLELPAFDRTSMFLQHWVLKEAFAKARGFGLNTELRSIAFSGIEAGHVRLHHDGNGADLAGTWQFTVMQLFDHFIAATAYKRHQRCK